jgi:UDP-N-acetylmuramoyl-tripeptide--D-alanyl-D-alanine ligase
MRLARKLRSIQTRIGLRLAAAVRARRHRTRFIAVTGSSAKTSTVLLLSHILQGAGRTHTLAKLNFMPHLRRSLLRVAPGTDYAVFELAVGHRGRMAPMAGLLRPQVGIVTLVALEHQRSLRTEAGVAAEKGVLLDHLPADGLAVLNADDDHVLAMAGRTAARVVTFGRENAADYRVTAVSAAVPRRLRLTLDTPAGPLPLQTRFVGDHHWVAVAAAAACAIEVGVDREVVAARVAGFEPLIDRCALVTIPDGPMFAVDTFKAPYSSLETVFEVLRRAEATRKRLVIGQVSDIRGDNRAAYRRIRRAATEVADQVVFVGISAKRVGAGEDDLRSGRIVCFDTVEAASDHVKQTAIADELIVLKGSKVLHLERIMLDWRYDVRCWEDRCRRDDTCFQCGRFRVPFGRQTLLGSIGRRVPERESARTEW